MCPTIAVVSDVQPLLLGVVRSAQWRQTQLQAAVHRPRYSGVLSSHMLLLVT